MRISESQPFLLHPQLIFRILFLDEVRFLPLSTDLRIMMGWPKAFLGTFRSFAGGAPDSLESRLKL
jgi:hypothetical protein